MSSRLISIPTFLHEIHGEKVSAQDLALTYCGGLFSLFSLLFFYQQSDFTLVLWKLILLLLVGADIGAGAVANFTTGTNRFYGGEGKRKTRLLFILLHFIHPAVFFFVLGNYNFFSSAITFFILGGTLLINSVEAVEKQRVWAAFFMVAGISLLLIFKIDNPFLLWFFPLFMVKLFLAFGIRRYA